MLIIQPKTKSPVKGFVFLKCLRRLMFMFPGLFCINIISAVVFAAEF